MDKVHFSTGKDDWETPQWLFNQLDDEFHFTLDPCCTAENAKCRKYYTKAENGLEQDWKGETVLGHPPYSRGKKVHRDKRRGLKNVLRNHKKRIRLALCCYQRVRTQRHFTHTYMDMPKSDLFAGD